MSAHIDRTLRDAWTGEATHPLPVHALRWLRARTGLVERPSGLARPGLPEVGPSALTSKSIGALTEVVGEGSVRVDGEARLGRTGGLSYLDLLAWRSGDTPNAPDAVALPGNHSEVVALLEVCKRHDIAVVPFGGGTSVVGGVNALRGDKHAVLAMDLARLNRMHSLDPISRTATFGAGVPAPEAERMLAQYGLTLGHYPQSFERATIGGFAATRSAGQASAGYGRFSEMVDGMRVAAPTGTLRLGVAPASAAGPDLMQLVLGSEGTLGVITEARLRVRELPRARRYEGFVFDGWDVAVDAVRALAQQRALADVTRLSDPEETEIGFTMAGALPSRLLDGYLRARGVRQPCLLVLGWEATADSRLKAGREASMRVLRGRGAHRLGTAVGQSWRHGRFAGPRQRDALLDAGMCVETLETATYWTHVHRLRAAVRDALTAALTADGVRPVVMCHISHAYETGASLYFTVLVPRSERAGREQWVRAKWAACEAISHGNLGDPMGTITHHHGVGVDHAPYLAAEIGQLGVDVLAAVKHTLDPSGIMNPGKLIGAHEPDIR